MHLIWDALPNRTYRVQYKSDLSEPTWTDLAGDITADGATAIKVDGMMHTSRLGMFAAGDICTYPGKLKLIATGFGEACTAVNFAKVWLDPHANQYDGTVFFAVVGE